MDTLSYFKPLVVFSEIQRNEMDQFAYQYGNKAVIDAHVSVSANRDESYHRGMVNEHLNTERAHPNTNLLEGNSNAMHFIKEGPCGDADSQSIRNTINNSNEDMDFVDCSLNNQHKIYTPPENKNHVITATMGSVSKQKDSLQQIHAYKPEVKCSKPKYHKKDHKIKEYGEETQSKDSSESEDDEKALQGMIVLIIISSSSWLVGLKNMCRPPPRVFNSGTALSTFLDLSQS